MMAINQRLYPNDIEQKIGFDIIRKDLISFCSNTISIELIQKLYFTDEYESIKKAIEQVKELMSLLSRQELPSLNVVDLRDNLQRISIDGTFLEETDLSALLSFLRSFHELYHTIVERNVEGQKENETFRYIYPMLADIFAGIAILPKLQNNIAGLLDTEGQIKDNATKELRAIRLSLKQIKSELNLTVQRLFKQAIKEGWVENDSNPTFREGRIVFPVVAMHKRSMRGIVHDESTTGKTIYIEPALVVEVNNKLRELELEERREVVKILKEVSSRIRPNIPHILRAYKVIGYIDMVNAKVRFAHNFDAICPQIEPMPKAEWYAAKHPILLKNLSKQGREVVPLDIKINKEQRILIISGPNAGGKSVCLKTVGLIQYMLQCGLPVPVREDSQMGLFSSIFIDIGDEQSIDNDLSTYSSHLRNMKFFLQYTTHRSLILIDEFGSGTEPIIGGALAQSILKEFNRKGLYGVITTHYHNIKQFAEDHKGVVNAAMLYDRHQMKPLFRLSIGRPGSSFAIEIAKKIGISPNIIDEASKLVGQDYIDQDKYLQDIVRDKKYWEQKRQDIRLEKKQIEEVLNKYNALISKIKEERAQIIKEAKKEATNLLSSANKKIEHTIKEIREKEAEKQQTKILREQLSQYQEQLTEQSSSNQTDIDLRNDRELQAILRRQNKKLKNKKATNVDLQSPSSKIQETSYKEGDIVCIKGQNTPATITKVDGDNLTIETANIKLTLSKNRVQKFNTTNQDRKDSLLGSSRKTSSIVDHIYEKRLHFSTDIDIRGMRMAEAIDTVSYFIDEAIQLSVPRVRILHGTGTGALRTIVRDYLSGVPSVHTYHDEDVRFGGAGITVVEMN